MPNQAENQAHNLLEAADYKILAAAEILCQLRRIRELDKERASALMRIARAKQILAGVK